MNDKSMEEMCKDVKDWWLERHLITENDTNHYIGEDVYFEYSLTSYQPVWREDKNAYVAPPTYEGCEYVCVPLDEIAVSTLGIEELEMEPNSLLEVKNIEYKDIESCCFIIIHHNEENQE